MKHLLYISATLTGLLLAGCAFSPTLDSAFERAHAAAGKAMDAGHADAERFQCNDASVGSVKRRYGKTAEDVQRYNTWCGSAQFGFEPSN